MRLATPSLAEYVPRDDDGASGNPRRNNLCRILADHAVNQSPTQTWCIGKKAPESASFGTFPHHSWVKVQFRVRNHGTQLSFRNCIRNVATFPNARDEPRSHLAKGTMLQPQLQRVAKDPLFQSDPIPVVFLICLISCCPKQKSSTARVVGVPLMHTDPVCGGCSSVRPGRSAIAANLCCNSPHE